MEFVKEEDKIRVLEGGPWWHKGNALIVMHYDSLVHPSKIQIQSIGLWIHFYDLPPAMMKHVIAQQLRGQLSGFMKSNNRYPSYLHIHVEYPLRKSLLPEPAVKIKWCGQMLIAPRYENFSTFVSHASESGMQQ
jgi:hypothetical protein